MLRNCNAEIDSGRYHSDQTNDVAISGGGLVLWSMDQQQWTPTQRRPRFESVGNKENDVFSVTGFALPFADV